VPLYGHPKLLLFARLVHLFSAALFNGPHQNVENIVKFHIIPPKENVYSYAAQYDNYFNYNEYDLVLRIFWHGEFSEIRISV